MSDSENEILPKKKLTLKLTNNDDDDQKSRKKLTLKIVKKEEEEKPKKKLTLKIVKKESEDEDKSEDESESEDKDKTKYDEREYPEIPDNLNIYEIATKFIPEGWEEEFTTKKAELKIISNLVKKSSEDYMIAPSNQDIFRAFYLTRKQDVRVIIIGQDPYPTANVANGLAFSVNDDINVPPSLKNIYKEMANCYPDTFKMPTSGNLEKLSRQGVFLINTCLTCPVGNAGGHLKPGNIWLPFISYVLENLTKSNKDIFVCVWGKHAQTMLPYIKVKKDRILEAAHPSPQNNARGGFLGCNHFKIINDKIEPPKIDWQI